MDKPLLSVAEARHRLLRSFKPTDVVAVPLLEALHLQAAEDIRAPIDFPLFDNSSMDGFAVKSQNVKNASGTNPVRLRVVGDVPAGVDVQFELKEGEAARIMTGAIVPPGADRVVPVEFTNINWQEGEAIPEWVEIRKSVDPGAYIRQTGEDFRAGEVVLTARKLQPTEIGFLAMLGISTVKVHRRPRVALFSSGDELLEPGQKLQPGKIFDANSYTLRSAIQQAGAECIWLGIIPDDKSAVLKVFDSAVESDADVILSTAGVSVGVFDFIRLVLEEAGAIHFWKVNMRPGKPLAFGQYRTIPFIGLPGNPVSAYVGFEVFVWPVLQRLLGFPEQNRTRIKARLQEAIESDGRESYLRGVVLKNNSGWSARLTGHQGSGNLHSLVEANALLIVPSGVKSLPAGSEIEAWMLDE